MAAARTRVAPDKAADDAAVEEMRQQFGDQEAARLAADLYKLRRSSGGHLWGVMPRWVIVIAALWVAMLETADKLPQLLLTVPRYKAALAEAEAKILQPSLLQAQLQKARNDVTISDYAALAAINQPRISAAELEKARNDAKTSAVQPALTAITLAKTALEAQAAAYQPEINEVQLAKLGIEARTATYQQGLTASQAIQAEQQTAAAQAMLSVLGPVVGAELKKFGVELPMDKLAPSLSIIDPAARTSDLQAAMPGSPVRRVARKPGS
jgi:hypothetical protein